MNTPYALLDRRNGLTRTVQPEGFVFHQGDTVAALYVVRCGIVRIGRLIDDGDEVTLSIARGGECFGALEVLLGLKVRHCFAQASVESIVQPFFRRDLSERDLADLARHAMAATYRSQICLAEMLPRNPARRLAILIGHLAAKGRIIRLSQGELGQAIGCPTETVTRALGQFEKAGAVSVGRRAIEVTKPETFAL